MEHPADTTMDATPPNSGVDISNNQEPSPRMESVVESNMNITMPDSADGVENAQKVYLNVQDPNMDVAMSNSGVDIGNAQEDVKQEIDTQRAESPLFVPDMSRKRKAEEMDSDDESNASEPEEGQEDNDSSDSDDDSANDSDDDDEYPHKSSEEEVKALNKELQQFSDDSKTYTYDPKKHEDKPTMPAYHPSAPKVEKELASIVQKLLNLILSSNYKGPEMMDLQQKIQKHLNPEYPEPMRVGVIGKPGQGKSSLINSLAHMASLAQTGCDGKSQTLVPQEFRQGLPDQKDLYRAVVTLHEPKACKEILRRVLNLFHSYCVEYGNRNKGEQKKDGEEEAFADVDTAMDVVMSLFADHDECKTWEDAQTFLKSQMVNDKAWETLLTRMDAWLEALLDDPKYAGGKIVLEHSHYRNFCKLLSPFGGRPKDLKSSGSSSGSKNRKARQETLWPIVRNIEITIRPKNCQALLKEQFIFVDLPGVSDGNRLREEVTREYLERCDLCIVVSKSDRAISDEEVRRSLRSLARDKGTDSLLMVCTETDKVDPDPDNMFEYGSHQHGRAVVLKHKIKIFEKELRSCNKKLKKCSPSKKVEFEVEQKKLDFQKRRCVDLLAAARILTRNENSTMELQRAYRQWTEREDDLKVFCVSNSAYRDFREGCKTIELPILSAKDTNIPALRDCLLRLPAPAKFEAIKAHKEVRLPILLNSIRLECNSNKIARVRSLDNNLEIFHMRFADMITQQFLIFRNETIDPIAHLLQFSGPQRIKKAENLCDYWEQEMQWATYLAFCRRSGKFKLHKANINWNDKLLEEGKSELDDAFTKQQEYCVRWADKFLAATIALVGDMVKALNNDPAVAIASLEKFYQNVPLRARELRNETKNICASMRDRFRVIGRRATEDSSIHGDSYLTEYLDPVYAFCVEKCRGQGSYKKRKKHFREAVLLPSGVFQHIYFTVLHECDMAFDTHKDRFKTLVDEVFGEILKDLNRITTTPENAAVEADLRKQLLNEVAAAEKQLNGRLAKLLADCERHR